MKKKIVLFYGREVGKKVYNILKKDKNIEILQSIAVSNKKKNQIDFNKNQKKKSWNLIYNKLKRFNDFTIITAWWGFIIPKKILQLSNKNTLNLHPSFLPYGKGKFPNMWAILNNEPFGSTLSSIDSNIDNGKIYVQKKIVVRLNSSAEQLYRKSIKDLLYLFKKYYLKIIKGNIKAKKPITKGSYYHSSKIKNLRKLYFDKKYKLSELINRVNACKFKGYPGTYFIKNKKKYHFEIKILMKN